MLRFIMFFFLLSCQQPSQSGGKKKRWGKKKKDNQAALLVDVSKVSKGNVSNHHEFTGVLESKSEASIIPDVSGLVKDVHVLEGDSVKKGDPLADLVNPSIDAALQRAAIEYKRAKREFNKTKQLQKQGAVSKREFSEAKSVLDTSKASFVEAEKSKKRLVVKSPLNGVVSTVSIRPGEQAGGTEAFRVVDPNQLRLVASIPERNMGELKPGYQVLISAAYDPNRQSTGQIERMGPVVDARTGSVKVFIDVETGQDQLLPGQFVRAKVQTDTHEDVLVIPKSALIYRDGQPTVFVLGPPPSKPETETDSAPSPEQQEEGSTESEAEDLKKRATNTALSKNLTIGYADEQWVEVVSGVSEGDDVITLGNTALRSGSPVRVEKPSSEAKTLEEPVPEGQAAEVPAPEGQASESAGDSQ